MSVSIFSCAASLPHTCFLAVDVFWSIVLEDAAAPQHLFFPCLCAYTLKCFHLLGLLPCYAAYWICAVQVFPVWPTDFSVTCLPPFSHHSKYGCYRTVSLVKSALRRKELQSLQLADGNTPRADIVSLFCLTKIRRNMVSLYADCMSGLLDFWLNSHSKMSLVSSAAVKGAEQFVTVATCLGWKCLDLATLYVISH